MKVTWRDGVATLATAGMVLLERAHINSWDWPLLSSARWAMLALAILGAISFVYGFIFDEDRGATWTMVGSVLGAAMAVVALFGLFLGGSANVTLFMFAGGTFWAASLLRHLTVTRASHA